MALSFVQLGILLLLVIVIMAVGVCFLVKVFVKTAPKDIQEKILARPDDPLWMTVAGGCEGYQSLGFDRKVS